MRYSTERKYRKCVKVHGPRKFGDKYGKKLIYAAKKTAIDSARAASKRIFQKTAEATGDLIGEKITDKITSVDKSKEREDETNKIQEINISSESTQEIIDDLIFL